MKISIGFRSIYALPLFEVFLIMLVWLGLWVFFALFVNRLANKKVIYAFKIINAILSLSFFAIILKFTVLGRAGEYQQNVSFIRTISRIKAEPELIREMVMNAFLFFPLGLTLPYALQVPQKQQKKTLLPIIITLIFSFVLTCVVEFLQYRFKMGNAELSDIICNTLGAAIGTVSYFIAVKLKDKEIFKK